MRQQRFRVSWVLQITQLTLGALREMRRDYVKPPFTPGEFIFDLQAKGLPKLASMLKPNIDLL